MNTAIFVKVQFWLLLVASALLLWFAPAVWHYSPDGGIYVGTAQSMAETGRYWFNGYPNLHYYPGLSSLLSLSILLFGLNFQVMHLMCAAITVICLWLVRSYFSAARYGAVGIAVPLVLLSASIFHRQAFNILSDGLFLSLTMCALLLWRRYAETSLVRYLVGCCIVVAVTPLVRFEGLIACATLGAVLLFEIWRNRAFNFRSFRRLAVICMAIIGPFALWTYRNWLLYTPDTFNAASNFFFGLQGLQLYAAEPALGTADPLWYYSVYRILIFVASLSKIFFTETIVTALPSYLWIMAFVVLSAAGVSRWFRVATNFERVFVILMLTFLFVWIFKGERSLYVVPRYWLSVLPFVIAMIGFGFIALYEAAKFWPLRYIVSASAVTTLLMVSVAGAIKITQFASKAPYYRDADTVLQKTADYVAKNVSSDLPVATTDWGVIPFRIDRRSYLVLNDPSHRLSLQRMLKYKTSYLIILDDLSAFPPVARKMVQKFSNVFTHVFEARPDGPGPAASIYKVDLSMINAVLVRQPK